MLAQKKAILRLASAHQLQLHPQSVKQLLDVIVNLDEESQHITLRNIFGAFHDECAGADRTITPEKMSKCISIHSSSRVIGSKGGTHENLHQVVPLDAIPSLHVDDNSTDSVRLLPSAAAAPHNRMHALRLRFYLALQRCYRSGSFRRNLSSVTEGCKALLAISSLEGISNTQEVCILGLVVRNANDTLWLEDPKSSIELDITNMIEPPLGFVSTNLLLIACGCWTGSKFSVSRLSLPPGETRAQTIGALGGMDTFGLAPPDVHRARAAEPDMLSSVCVTLAHVHLDSQQCLSKLGRFFREFEGRREEELAEMTFVIVGDFVTQPWSLGDIGHLGEGNQRKAYQALIDGFGALVQQHAPTVAGNAMFVLVPGPNDPTALVGALPQTPLPGDIASGLQTRLKRVVFASNPCRIRFLTQEIVICRKDFYHDMLSLAWKWPNAQPLEGTAGLAETDAVVPTQGQPAQFELVCKTIGDAAHLAPLDSNILWRYDAALRVVPLPQLLVLCDRTEQWQCRYKGSNFVNPGSFAASGTFLWYTPCDGEFVLNQIY